MDHRQCVDHSPSSTSILGEDFLRIVPSKPGFFVGILNNYEKLPMKNGTTQ